ncbi:EMC4 protein, partial [Erithacus rubecula]|nr:EMC4 protein [Erithacus rubecula]
RALMPSVPPALKALESSSRRALQGLVFLVGNGLGLALALYKCQAMGLLPTRPSDWLAFVTPPQRMEFTGGGLIL